jgi:hypothetical protein
MQDPNPLPWGTQDKFQAHFIVRKTFQNPFDYTAKTIISTKGHFGSKKIVGVKWIGGKFANVLNEDTSLNDMIIKQSVKDAAIFVDPTESGIRIYGKWKNSFEFGITKELFDIYDKIAGHIKTL